MKQCQTVLQIPQILVWTPALREDSDGATLITEEILILQRWAEHFQSILNRPSSISNVATDRMPQADINHRLDVPPSETKTLQAISELSSGKAPGSDAIPA